MDLNIKAADANISTHRGDINVTCYLSGVDESDLLSSENFQQIGIDRFIGEFGAENVLKNLKELYPELF